jgi:Tol biopolymer transport system component
MNTRTLCQVALWGTLLSVVLALAASSSGAGGNPLTGDIYVVSSGGGASHALTSAPDGGLQPSLSPNGRLIAYSSHSGVRLMSTDGSDQRALEMAAGERPQWAPDGRSLVYTGANGDLCYPGPAQRCVVGELRKVNADGSGVRELFYAADHPVWSPKGRWLAFRDFVVGEVGEVVGALKVAWPDGSHVRTLFRGEAIDGQRALPTWSPDGKWIAFNTWRGEAHRLYVIRADGSHLRRLIDGTYPAWSPNGKLIAFERFQRQRPYGIWVISPTGKHARRISANGECPSWSPRGKRIAFLTKNRDFRHPSRLGVVRADGRGRKVLAVATDCYERGWAEPSPPMWSADGRSIYFGR